MKKILLLIAVILCLSFIGYNTTNSSNTNKMNANTLPGVGIVGEIKLFAGNFAPEGWAFCQGQTFLSNDYPALFDILGDAYGGSANGQTFNLPDLRGRVAIGAGQGQTSQRGLLPLYERGQQGGFPTNTLVNQELPTSATITNAYQLNPEDGNSQFKQGNTSLVVVGNTSNTTVKATVQSQDYELNNMQPYTTLNYIICIKGAFPNRN